MTDASSEWWRYLYEGVGVPVGDLDRLIDAIADRLPPPRAVAADRPLVRKFIRAHILGAIKAGERATDYVRPFPAMTSSSAPSMRLPAG